MQRLDTCVNGLGLGSHGTHLGLAVCVAPLQVSVVFLLIASIGEKTNG